MGKCTRRPERVVQVEVGVVVGGMFAQGKDLKRWCENVQEESRWAGLRRSIETVSLRPCIEMVKCLSVREMTGKGPS